MMNAGEWINKMVDSVGQHMHLETTDGVRREGKISGFTFRQFLLNGEKVKIPIEIEVNGDPSDRVSLERIDYMNID